ncbi:MAG TPA: GGDEF domain-containing protein [Acidimicrobiales bacterium]|nr:GGDEF domain-containing protein [Acidimicrobiales bacterium]
MLRRQELSKAVRLGAYVTACALALVSVYELVPRHRPMPLDDYGVVIGLALVSVTAIVMAGDRVLALRHAEYFLYAWSVADVAVIGAAVAWSGGGRSSVYLLFILTSLFSVSYYPVRAQVLIGIATAACYLCALAVTGWGVDESLVIMRLSIIGLVSLLGSTISSEKQRLGDESERRASLLATVATTAREVNVLDASKVLQAVVDGAARLGLEWSHVSLIDETSATYRIVAARSIPDEYLKANPPVTSGMMGLVYRSRETIRLSRDDAAQYVVPVIGRNAPELTGVIGAPLWVDGQLAGLLAGATKKRGGLGDDEVESFELLASTASRALEGARRFEQMAESEARNRHQALHDDLTGLANRALLNIRLREELAWGRNNGPVALLLADLDDFKLLNDTLGHGVGDQLLVAIAERLMSCVRDTDTVARLSGDEFAILVSGMSLDELDKFARRVIEIIGQRTNILDHLVSVEASLGIAISPANAVGAEELETAATEIMSNADVAMYEAKRAGKHCHIVFDQGMTDRLRRRVTIERDLLGAAASGELNVLYQPIFELADRRIIGFEALLRWRNPRLGQVSPAEFIPIAEETGAIVPIGRWVLRQACAELAALREEDPAWAQLHMSVNLSTRQLRDPGLVDEVLSALSDHCLPASSLTLEITESSLLDDKATCQAKLSTLGDLGVQVALDDFGTGYSSLAYLQQLHVHSLKIDKCFVDGVVGSADRTGPALIRSIAELGSALDLTTVAEGIETESQLAELRRFGCRLGQGWVFAPAVTPQRMRELLARSGAEAEAAPAAI